MVREIMAETLEKEYEIISEVGKKAVDLSSIRNEMEKIIGYEIYKIRFKDGTIIGIIINESNPIK